MEVPSSQQFVHEDAQRPQIGREVVALVENDFRRDVLRRPAERPCLPALSDALRKAEVHLKTITYFVILLFYYLH